MPTSFSEIAVLSGGPSAERDVSLKSGAAVARGLREAGRTVHEVVVDQRLDRLPEGVQAVFPALHGAYGEDGGVQTDLEALGLPYVGTTSAAMPDSFDKLRTKRLWEAAGLPTPAWAMVTDAQAPCPLPFPVVVKPPLQGSSVGVHKVYDAAGYITAMTDALQFGHEVLVEELVEGRELTAGVLLGEALPVVEIRPEGGTYDYHAKYVSGTTEYLCPAPLTEDQTAEIQRLALAAFAELGCRHMGRIDFLLAPDGRVTMLECNSLPGFTSTSLLPKAAAAQGISFPDLCDRLVQAASLPPIQNTEPV